MDLPARIVNRARTGLSLALVSLLAAVGLFAEKGPWRTDASTVRVICPLTVGGSFDAKTTALTGRVAIASPRAPLAGRLSVDLRTLDTGIDLRNTHMRQTYLETDKGEGFDRAVLSDILLGDVDAETFRGRTTFSGVLLLHGVRRPISGEVEIERGSPPVRVNASFRVTLSDFGIATPQYLGVGVRQQVQVRVQFVATPVAADQVESR